MRALIVEDEKNLAFELKKFLEKEKFSVSIEYNGEDAIDKILGDKFDIILLDIMLPEVDGFKVLQFIRKEKIGTPVIILTAKTEVDDRVKGLDLGADDYIVKPFSSSELIARIRAILRRSSGESSNIITVGEMRLNLKQKIIYFKDKKINLSPKEYSVFEFLILNKGKPVSKYDIAEHIWGDSYDILSTSNFVEVHIKNIRKKLLKYTEKTIIKTIRGFGYLIENE